MTTFQPHLILDHWLGDLRINTSSNLSSHPNYWAQSPQKLISSSQPLNFSLGTGSEILSSVLSKCLSTRHELVIVTCFWAKSSSQEAVSSLLVRLSEKGMEGGKKIQVRLCFSSCSLLQKLFQTSNLEGKIYPPSTWLSLGLPAPEDLRGIELVVKSVFVRPFSVIHPKFILMDREVAWMPSCNVSWEEWFEGCIELRGGITEKLFEFWNGFWGRGLGALPPLPIFDVESPNRTSQSRYSGGLLNEISFNASELAIQTVLLPSPHHINPSFRPLLSSTPPPTPLNTFLLTAFSEAKHSLYIQTPNLTSGPVISALFSALELGVSITIVTSSKLMILEQLVTAGTITEFELWKLRRRYQALLKTYTQNTRNGSNLENQRQKPGKLRIGYYHAKQGARGGEPVKSHLKLVIIDEEITVLGSGNMDRASWYTSQELGVSFFDGGMARRVRACVDEGLEGRVDYVY